MNNKVFHILDVFAEGKYQGNQLAVFTDGTGLTDSEMLQIAKEINFSETTFIMSREAKNEGYDVRIFTPAEEVPFAGHPTLGTAYILKNEVLKTDVDTIRLNLKAGQIPVKFSGDQNGVIWMKQNQPEFYEVFDPKVISEILNVDKDMIDDKFPVQSVSTGLGHIVVPMKSLDAVKSVVVDKEKYFTLIEKVSSKSILVFSDETYNKENDVNVRVLGDYYGVPEDPATGSGNGCLAAYLVKNRYFGGSSIDIRSEQGYEIGRPSLLYLKASEKDGEFDVNVGGKVVPIARGEFLR